MRLIGVQHSGPRPRCHGPTTAAGGPRGVAPARAVAAEHPAPGHGGGGSAPRVKRLPARHTSSSGHGHGGVTAERSPDPRPHLRTTPRGRGKSHGAVLVRALTGGQTCNPPPWSVRTTLTTELPARLSPLLMCRLFLTVLGDGGPHRPGQALSSGTASPLPAWCRRKGWTDCTRSRKPTLPGGKQLQGLGIARPTQVR